MNNLLINLLALAVTLGVLIAFHEFGHFWVARRLGVKVLRFSVGFGRPLWRRRGQVDDTEFVLAAIPLGGYVRMLDEREGAVAAEERHRAFNRQPVGARIAIVAAGPLFNFLFAVVAYSLIFMVGVPAMRPLISDVTPGSRAAEAGFQASDVIVAVNGDPTPSMQSVLLALLESAMDREVVTVQVQDADGRPQQRSLDLRDAADLPQNAGLLPSLGFELPSYPPVIGGLVEDGAAAEAGFAPGDRIVEVDGRPVEDWSGWAAYVRERPGQPLEVVVDRQGRRLALTVTPREVQSDQGRIGQIGAYVQEQGDLFKDLRIEVSYGPLESVARAVGQTWDMALFTLRMLGRMVIGRASLENISGPITIAQFAGQTAASGGVEFLAFLALVSISLGVLNLLPIPILDGGHLLYYLIELVKGDPLPEAAQNFGQRLGIVLLLMLMGLALFNDISHLLRQ